MLILPFMPESPRYLLVNKNDEEGATKGTNSSSTSAITAYTSALTVHNKFNIQILPYIRNCTFTVHASIIALVRFRGTNDVVADLEEMKLEQAQAELEQRWTFKQLLSSKQLRMPLILVVALASSQQLSGINAVSHAACRS